MKNIKKLKRDIIIATNNPPLPILANGIPLLSKGVTSKNAKTPKIVLEISSNL